MGKQAFSLWTLVALTFSLATPVLAGVERWTPYGPPEGFLVTLAVDGDRLYAATDESGVVASADRGLTWFRSSTGMGNERVEAIAVDPDDHVLYAAGQNRFFQSVDAGAHWTVLGQLPAQEPPGEGEEPVHDVLALSPGEPGTFFLSIGRFLYRSTDGGRAWTPVLTWTTAIQSVLVDPNDPRSLFVGTRGPESSFLHSPDGGVTWAQVTNVDPAGPPPDTPPFSHGVVEITAAATTPTTLFALSGNSGSNLYRSADAGATWREIRLPPPGDGVTVSVVSVVATPGLHPRVYAFQNTYTGNGSFNEIALFASDDLGDTWLLSTEAARGYSLRVDPVTGALFSFNANGVGIAVEEGAPWRFSPLGANCNYSDSYGPLPKVRFAPGRTYALVGGRLWESRDGRSWTALARDLTDRCIEIRDVTVDRRPGVLWAAAQNGVYRSNDGGTTWNLSLAGDDYGFRDFRAVTQLDAHTILVSGNRIWRSGDRGATWQKTMSHFVLHSDFSEPEFERSVCRMRVEPGNPEVVYASVVEYGERHPPLEFAYIYQSLDGGRTWHALAGDVYTPAVDPTHPQRLYGFGVQRAPWKQGVMRSNDRGRHWELISDSHRGLGDWCGSDLQVDPNDPRVLYSTRGRHRYGDFREEQGVWRSIDRGVTWAPLRVGMDSLPVYEISLDPRRPGRLFAASREGLFTGLFGLPAD